MHRRFRARCAALLLVPSLAGPAKALDALDVTEAGSHVRPGVTESSSPSMEGNTEHRAPSSQSPPEQRRWAVRAENWGSAHRWSLTNGSLVFDLTITQTHHGSTLVRDGAWNLGLQQTGVRRHALFEGPARSSTRRSFIDKLGVGWTPAPSRDLLPRRAWDLRLGESDRVILRLRRGVLSVFAQRTF